MIEFEWDEKKNEINIAKHGIDFKTAAGVFYEDHAIRKSSNPLEDRWLATGIVKGLRMTVVFTIRQGRIRIISARRARKNE
ncbi:MAG: BrnT family toxin [bacterium]